MGLVAMALILAVLLFDHGDSGAKHTIADNLRIAVERYVNAMPEGK